MMWREIRDNVVEYLSHTYSVFCRTSLLSLFIKSLALTFRSRFRQQFENYIVVGDLLGHTGVLYQLFFDGDTYVMFSKQFLELFESLQCRERDE